VRYTVATQSHVSLRVFDLAGRVVRTLLDREARPGEYRITWDGTTDAGTRAATGVYFVRMEAEGDTPFSSARKIVLIR
jgi:flagellar hook assembly protein FlgD